MPTEEEPRGGSHRIHRWGLFPIRVQFGAWMALRTGVQPPGQSFPARVGGRPL